MSDELQVHVYCGHHTHVSLISDGDQGECGWETTITANAEEWAEGFAPRVTCGSCGAELWRDDMEALS